MCGVPSARRESLGTRSVSMGWNVLAYKPMLVLASY